MHLATSLALLSLAATPSLEDVFAKVDNAVVTVRVGMRQMAQTETSAVMAVSVGTGSGVLLHKDGFVVTAAHVVEDAEVIEVQWKDGSSTGATVVTLSRSEDVALLKVDDVPKSAQVVTLGDSDGLKAGQRVFAVGAPMGLEHTLTSGVVSALRTNPERGFAPRKLIQTDVPINQGNSGGPLFNEAGEVVGIASFILSTSGGSMGLGFAVPSNTVRRRLFEHALPYVGVSLRYIPREVAEVFNWTAESGLLVEKVRPGSIAAKAGLRGGVVTAKVAGNEVLLGGDLILTVNGQDTSKTERIGELLRGLKVGDTITYDVLRGGKLQQVKMTLPELVKVPALAGPKKK
ncbi:MAG: trypsin-like peptidase domain-containing protein [Myxococcales bacterium]|nr:trypsin-like peptidase domain-containing protein [Myxococcales bacterium]